MLKSLLRGGLLIFGVAVVGSAVGQGPPPPPPPPPSMPTVKEQCFNGGWQAYKVFKNQGDCVSFVATKGKNPPSK